MSHSSAVKGGPNSPSIDSFPAKKRPRADSESSQNELKSAFRTTFAEHQPRGVILSDDIASLLARKSKKRAMTFDEITLADQPVEFHPNDVILRTFVTRNFALQGAGIMSAAMDTVTERETALAMAKMGGVGIIHRHLTPEAQAEQVKWVRRKIHYGGMIDKPITFKDDDHFSFFQRECAKHNWHFTSFPVVDKDNKMLGLVTREALEFVDQQANPQLKEVMLRLDQITVVSSVITTEEAYRVMKKHKVKKLPVIDERGCLFGMYVWNDVNSDQRKRDRFSLDQDGHFLVGAAIGTAADEIKRAKLLVDAGCKIIVVDSTGSYATESLKKQIVALRKEFGDSIDIVAGNIASYSSALYLLEGEGKPDSIKVGIGGGSTATTRDLTGHGIPQITALYEVWKAVQHYGDKEGYYVPIIADGGIRTSGDIVKAFAVGASGIMLGSLMAGTFESPGRIVEKAGRKWKEIRGMGGVNAENGIKFGVQGRVPLSGTVEMLMTQLLGGVQSGLAHSGAMSIAQLQQKVSAWVQSFAGVAEGKPHDILDVRG